MPPQKIEEAAYALAPQLDISIGKDALTNP